MMSSQFSNDLTTFPPIVTPVKPWNSSQIAIFVPPPSPFVMTSFMDNPYWESTKNEKENEFQPELFFCWTPNFKHIFWPHELNVLREPKVCLQSISGYLKGLTLKL